MKSNDNVRVFEHSMLVHFGSTGESQTISTIDLGSRGVSFSLLKDEKAIAVRLLDLDVVLSIETFATEQLANAGYQYLQGQLKRYARHRRFAAWYKRGIKWVLAPLLAFVFIVSLNTAVTATLVSGPAVVGVSPVSVQHSEITAALAPEPLQRPVADVALRSAKPRPDSKLLANALRDGVATNKYSIQLSRGTKGSLYVFSDPLCQYCQRLEPQLEKLAADYTIHVFPVSVIGGDDSQKQLGPMLCGATEARSELWKKAISGNIEKLTTSCDQVTEVLAANNEFFRAMLFEGTPVIVNAEGNEFPSVQRATAENISHWLAGTTGASR